ncbi:TnsD family Tn7-like transposition protein [Clostridium botulinum]|uniref:TnsD family Tn7-like transposition protein n=2 Tax=Clostridium botulinum TaxID=1491 RepID=UPI0013F0A0E5|nr:TnsD family Tn7-like transposition protein [Clostridium botulinum]MBN1063614.1 hypothetical protein [Clostridium botulinum]MBY6949424.1 TniQ family protein [Clostridium botulinum]MBY7023067.1 TniQ family protein [Clostridium botulinum]NFF23871.1 hypothetical protein [Clostridium botulinum]NFF35974.1 hypothetical protein [Clostridium botulinum]
MLDFFTDPYKDELIYSTIARYHFYSGNVDYKDTIEECFGKRTMIATLEIGGNFEYLAKVLGKRYSSDDLINKHTIMPYYEPFIDEQLKQKTIDEIKNKGSYSVYTRLGIIAGAICKKDSIFYCPECAKNDIADYGEPYIHREHQLEGILLCPHHGILLKRYLFKKIDVSRIEYIRLEEQYMDLKAEPIDIEDYDRHLKLARDSYYLLNKKFEGISKEKISMKYRNLLYKKGLLKGNNTINQKELYEQFISYYRKTFLEQLDCAIDFDNDYNWLKVISRKSKRSSHPLRHLLFINFLGEDIRDFFDNIDDSKVGKIKNRDSIYSIEKVDLEKLNEYKDVILKMKEKNKVILRTALRKQGKKEYMYIYRYDKAWLFNNLPNRAERKADNKRIDWNIRDRQYLKALKEKYKELINDDDMIRITKGSLSKPLGILSNIEKKLEYLPLTKNFFDEVCESTEAFQIRRAKAAIDKQIDAQVGNIRLWEIQRIAAIRSEQFKQIKCELENYLKGKWVEKDYGKQKKT